LPDRLLPPVSAAPRQPTCLASLDRPAPVLAPERRSLPHARAAHYPRRSHSQTLRTAFAPMPCFASHLIARLVFPHVVVPLRCSAAHACIPACVLGHLPMPLALPSRPLFNPQWSLCARPPADVSISRAARPHFSATLARNQCTTPAECKSNRLAVPRSRVTWTLK
jgi:hypothetical protein